jgi:P2-related tail formation protein
LLTRRGYKGSFSSVRRALETQRRAREIMKQWQDEAKAMAMARRRSARTEI